MDKQLTWREIKAFHQLYFNGSTRAKIEERPYVRYLIDERFIEYKRGSKKILVPTYKFPEKYEKEGFFELYNKYYTFLAGNDILTDYTNLSEFEIRGLINMVKSEPLLNELKEKIKDGQESRKGVSNLFFKSAKYIQKDSALERAVLKLLGINEFPQSDNQGFYRVPCKNPISIILCENMYFLTLNIAQQNNVELWCAGGNNTKPFENLPKIDSPLFYLCDWDYDGLKIYERIYEIIANVPNKKTPLRLIYPNGKKESIISTEEYHRSQWNRSSELGGLKKSLYSDHQVLLIKNLIEKNEWIEEESNNLVKIINELR
jgi:hypothetical protein